jgi:hypothetical protein
MVEEVFFMDTRERSTEKQGGYKKNWPKWVGLYLLIAGIAYLIVYFVAFHHGGGAAGGGY